MAELLTCCRLTKQVVNTASVCEAMADPDLPDRPAGSVLPEVGGAVPQLAAPQYLTHFHSLRFGRSILSSAPMPARTQSPSALWHGNYAAGASCAYGATISAPPHRIR